MSNKIKTILSSLVISLPLLTLGGCEPTGPSETVWTEVSCDRVVESLYSPAPSEDGLSRVYRVRNMFYADFENPNGEYVQVEVTLENGVVETSETTNDFVHCGYTWQEYECTTDADSSVETCVEGRFIDFYNTVLVRVVL